MSLDMTVLAEASMNVRHCRRHW